jgi:hypothetical protein
VPAGIARFNSNQTRLGPESNSFISQVTVTVGDGVSSHGDFDSIEAAIAYLPSTGGEVSLLPGLHQANERPAAQRGERGRLVIQSAIAAAYGQEWQGLWQEVDECQKRY